MQLTSIPGGYAQVLALVQKHQDILEMSEDQLFGFVLQRIFRTFNQTSKVGATFTWATPPIYTCFRGSTPSCRGDGPEGEATIPCYAWRIWIRRPVVRVGWTKNLAVECHPRFPQVMSRVMACLPECLFRLYVSGDFWKPSIAKAWIRSIELNGHVHAFGFTRAWQDRKIRSAIIEGGMGWPRWLLASTDKDTPPLPDVTGMREAAMTDTSKRLVMKGKIPPPTRFVCDEENPNAKAQDCAACGRCPMWRLKDGKFKELPKTAATRVDFLRR